MRGSTINKIKKNVAKLDKDITKHAKILTTGTVLCIDPSSGSEGSMPGYARFREGELIDSGTLEINPKLMIQFRLEHLFNHVRELGLFDVLLIERIRGNTAHEYLRWAVGVTIAGVSASVVLEIPTTVWKREARATEDYVKGDEQDALMMGKSVIRKAREVLNVTDPVVVPGNSKTSTAVRAKRARTKMARK